MFTVALLSAEFIGRGKHIGRNYSFLMMLGIIPGMLGLIFSPSAKNKPTKSNSIFKILGALLIIGGLIGLFKDIENLTLIQIFANVSLISSSLYCFELSKGNIINKEPKYYFNNSTKIIAEKSKNNLENSIFNLTDLKQKGILTDDEYKQKIVKIEYEKKEQNLLNSTEYKQLKSLFDSGVLTKEEFESKIELLSYKFNDFKEFNFRIIDGFLKD